MLNEVLREKLYGLRENSTAELTVNQVVDEQIENKLINCSVFFDLAKAFNTVNHSMLNVKFTNGLFKR